MELKHLFILLPLIFSIIPFALTGNFIILGGISVTIFIVGAVFFALVFSLNIGGAGQVVATGVEGRLGLNQEGTYMLFVLVFGGLFYGVTTFIALFADTIVGIWNFFLGWLGLGIDLSGSTINMGSYVFTSPSSIYPISFTIGGFPIFGLLTVFMGLMYILGMFFLVSSRGK